MRQDQKDWEREHAIDPFQNHCRLKNIRQHNRFSWLSGHVLDPKNAWAQISAPKLLGFMNMDLMMSHFLICKTDMTTFLPHRVGWELNELKHVRLVEQCLHMVSALYHRHHNHQLVHSFVWPVYFVPGPCDGGQSYGRQVLKLIFRAIVTRKCPQG